MYLTLQAIVRLESTDVIRLVTILAEGDGRCSTIIKWTSNEQIGFDLDGYSIISKEVPIVGAVSNDEDEKTPTVTRIEILSDGVVAATMVKAEPSYAFILQRSRIIAEQYYWQFQRESANNPGP